MSMNSTPKRKQVDVSEYQFLEEPTTNVSVHGILKYISAVKWGKRSNYFEGTVSDGNTQLHFVGFYPAQQKMEDLISASFIARLWNKAGSKMSKNGDNSKK